MGRREGGKAHAEGERKGHANVRMILDTVSMSLARDPARKFTYVEQAFFQRWYAYKHSHVHDVSHVRAALSRACCTGARAAVHVHAHLLSVCSTHPRYILSPPPPPPFRRSNSSTPAAALCITHTHAHTHTQTRTRAYNSSSLIHARRPPRDV